MGIVRKKITAPAAGALLLLSISLGGRATSTAGSSLMDARAEASTPPKTNSYLPVEDLPPKREPAMTPDERLRHASRRLACLLSGEDRKRWTDSQNDANDDP
jgi:hypothetical protein